ncbi:hypothetical protein ACHQM5_017235 [Ranunculus cassubicifolius]
MCSVIVRVQSMRVLKHWMLDKLGGAFAPKPSSGPHKSRECLLLILILRNRLKYALTYCEVVAILMQRHILVDGKVRTDKTYPAGFMDVVSIPKTNENFRLIYDTKGRFRLHSIKDEEAKFKLCKVRSVQCGQKGIPYLNTYDGRTIRYPDPLIRANDTIKLDLETGKIVDFIKLDVGNVVLVTGGRNRGRVGVIKSREKHKGTFETIHLTDVTGHEFATRLGNGSLLGFLFKEIKEEASSSLQPQICSHDERIEEASKEGSLYISVLESKILLCITESPPASHPCELKSFTRAYPHCPRSDGSVLQHHQQARPSVYQIPAVTPALSTTSLSEQCSSPAQTTARPITATTNRPDQSTHSPDHTTTTVLQHLLICSQQRLNLPPSAAERNATESACGQAST